MVLGLAGCGEHVGTGRDAAPGDATHATTDAGPDLAGDGGGGADAADAAGPTDGATSDGDVMGPSDGGSPLDASMTQTLPLPGTASPATKLSIPAKIATLGLQKDPYVIAGYLDVTRYGADPTGVKDSTAAFQAAINDAAGDATGHGGTSMVVYVPTGTYSVSDTLTGIQTWNVNNYGYGSIQHYGGLLSPSLVGNPRTRPTIVLKDGSAGFGSASSPKPIVRLVNTPNGGTGACGYQWQDANSGCWDVLFNAVVRDLDVKTGNNPGAIGVQMYAAQKSYIQNVSVDATGGYAGFQGTPGTELWLNLAVTGGQYGLLVNTGGGNAAFAGLTLSGQGVAAISQTHIVGDLAITGFDIRESGAAAAGIILTDAIAQGTTLSLVDGVITTASTTQPPIANTGGDSIYLESVYLQSHSGELIVNHGSTSIAANGQMQLVSEYAHVDQGTNTPNPSYKYALGGYIVTMDNTGTQLSEQQSDYGPTFGASTTPPTDLVLRHVPMRMPWAFDTNIVWVTDQGADPTGFSDSTVAIQNAIELAHTSGSDEVFIPRGDYSLTATLHLHPDTKFFGIPGSYANFIAWGWVTHGKLQPMIQVGDAVNDVAATAAGTAIMSDISFSMPVNAVQFPAYAKLLPNDGAGYQVIDQTYLGALVWQTGKRSVLNQVNVAFQYNQLSVASPPDRNYIQIDHSGGGRWYGLQVAGDWGPNGANGYTLLATGTTQPLTLYGSNPEHSNGLSFYGFSNAKNIRVLGLKMESGGNKYLVYLDASSNVMLSGFSCHGEFRIGAIGGSTNLNFNTAMYFTEPGTDVAFFTDLDSGKTYSFADAYALMKVGSFDPSVFPTCSNGLSCTP